MLFRFLFASLAVLGSGANVTETATEESTVIVTVTSCSEDKCSSTTVPTGLTTITVTTGEITTEFTTYCPLTGTTVTPFQNSSVPVTSSKTPKTTPVPVVPTYNATTAANTTVPATVPVNSSTPVIPTSFVGGANKLAMGAAALGGFAVLL